MACYPCTHCNRCGVYSISYGAVCGMCGAPIPPGTAACPNCGADVMGGLSLVKEEENEDAKNDLELQKTLIL